MSQEQIDIAQSWIDRLKELGFRDLVLFDNGRGIWARDVLKMRLDILDEMLAKCDEVKE